MVHFVNFLNRSSEPGVSCNKQQILFFVILQLLNVILSYSQVEFGEKVVRSKGPNPVQNWKKSIVIDIIESVHLKLVSHKDSLGRDVGTG